MTDVLFYLVVLSWPIGARQMWTRGRTWWPEAKRDTWQDVVFRGRRYAEGKALGKS